MKLPPNLLHAVISILQQIFGSRNRFADDAIRISLKENPRWGSRDRRFIAETSYEAVRWWRLLWEIAGQSASQNEEDLKKIIGILFRIQGNPYAEHSFFKTLESAEILRRYEILKNERKFRESIPDWIDSLGAAEMGGKWDAEIHALNRPASVVLRTNTLKITRPLLIRKLADEEVPCRPDPLSPVGLILEKRQNVFITRAFQEGLFEVQDSASQAVSLFMDASPGMRVIDACAGAGGKTLHLAALMQNQGKIIALDVDPYKLSELERRARRAGVQNVEVRPISSGKIIKRLYDSADRLLLDVPCSGLGVLRRNPDAKWKLTLERVQELVALQKKILEQYCKLTRPGGILIYATCSILERENQNQIGAFLTERAGAYDLLEEKHFSPVQDGTDGFYMAKMIRRK